MGLSKDWCPSDSEIAPTRVWYENHLRNGGVRWQHKVVAWGLNISRADLYNLQFDLIYHFSRSGEDLACISLHVKDSDIEEFEKLYRRLPRMYAWVEVSRLWSQEAITQFIRRVRSIVPKLLEASDIDGVTGKLSEKGRSTYTPSMTPWPTKLEMNFDCLVEIFALSGLRPKTLKIVAKKLGFDDNDQTYLVRNRSDPTFLKELVDKPHELLMMMHDCDVLLSGSRVTTYFWPGFDSSGSDWDFYAHPNVHSWLKFAVYLVSVGVEWTIPDVPDQEEMDIYHGSVLSGRLSCNGRHQKVQLVTHRGCRRISSIEAILAFHSSIVQNFICGFGAISMYGSLTTAGLSHAWEPREWFDSKIYEADQEAVNKYVQRGVQYIPPDQAATGFSRVPLPKGRTLVDAGTICVPFDDYIQRCLDESAAKLSSSERLEQERKKQSRLNLIQNDLKLLQNVEWWEISSRLIARKYGEETPFWDWGSELRAQWAHRDKMKHDMQPYVSQFENLKPILSCANCNIYPIRFCERHNSTGRTYKDLCLAHWNLINYEGALESDRVFGSNPDDRVGGWGYDGYPFI